METSYLISIFIAIIAADFSYGNARCPPPVTPENGKSTLLSRGYLVKYECIKPAIMVGYAKAICDSKEWSHKAPKCVLPPSKRGVTATEKPSTQGPIKALNSKNQDADADAENKVSSGEMPPLNDDIYSKYIRRYRAFYDEKILEAKRKNQLIRVESLKKGLSKTISILMERRRNYYAKNQHVKNDQDKPKKGHDDKSEVNKCEKNNGGCMHNCKIEHGEVSCSCQNGYMLNVDNGVSCEDIDECSSNFGRGPCSDKCTNNIGSFQCSCLRRGTKLSTDGKSCQDVNECEIDNFGCSHTCTNIFGSAYCSCPIGYILRNKKTCEDVNECEIPDTNCDGRCINLAGSYKCIEEVKSTTARPIIDISNECFISGLRKNRFGRCVDINECENNNFGCSHKCYNFYSGAFCGCPYGHRRIDSKTCEDIDECKFYGKYLCSFGCINTPGSYQCSCPPGFIIDGDFCQDINECAVNNGGCSHTCVNHRGSMECKCPHGFELLPDQKTCRDINECLGRNPCHHRCINLDGGFKCACNPGHLLLYNNRCVACRKNSYKMEDQNSCEECPPFSYTNGEGKASIKDCICDDGFEGNLLIDDTCHDIDECSVNNFNCSDNCVNTPGGAHCSCSDGYEIGIDGKTCIDVDECVYGNGGCDHVCQNIVGSFKCSCHENYIQDVLDQRKCIDIDECDLMNGGCSHNCFNFKGGYRCECPHPMRLSGDGKTCIDSTCPDIPRQRNGKIFCDGLMKTKSMKLIADMKCEIRCNKGYHVSGTNELVCLSNGSWFGSVPYCTALKCPKLERPLNGNVSPSSCYETQTAVRQKCYYTCNTGYSLVGRPGRMCMRSQTWSPITAPHCSKVLPEPFIQCPPDIKIILDEGDDSKAYVLSKPISNMDEKNILMDPAWVRINNSTFEAGITEVLYTAVNPISNKTASCITTVEVVDAELPKVQGCPSDITVKMKGAKEISVYWNEPVFRDNVAIQQIWQSNTPGSKFSAGVHTITYTATDAAKNQAECSFTVSVKASECPTLNGPKNGKQFCMDWSYGKICQPKCAPSHMWYDEAMHSTRPQLFACGSDMTWKPSSVIPDCYKFRKIGNITCDDGEEKRYFNGENICIQCPIGMYAKKEDTTCQSCPMGHFTEFPASTECKRCEDLSSIDSKTHSNCS